MRRFYSLTSALLISFALSFLTLNAQPWSYDFGTGTGTYTVNNSASIIFLNNIELTPSNGGTYRVRRGNQDGGFTVANPGTSLGSGSELQIQGPTGGSTNKLTVYGWDNPAKVAYVKFKMRTKSSATGSVGFHLGSGASTVFQDGFGYSNFTNSIVAFQISYASGGISSVVRRNNVSNTPISNHGFLKDTDQEIEVYANNATTSANYNKGGSNSLNARSWDLWVDGVKISPAGGFFSAGNWEGDIDIAGFGFFTESNNNVYVYLDDLEYSNQIPNSCLPPTESIEGFNDFSVADQTSIELEWLNGNGAGRVIVMNTSNIFTDLLEGENPIANTTYSGSGEQVVYNGTGNSPIIIDGLFPNTPYYFKGFEYCSPERVYDNTANGENVTTLMGSTSIFTDTVTYGPFCNGSSSTFNVGFSKSGTFNDPFKVQISNEFGIFPGNLEDNIIGSNSVSPISATIPLNITPNGLYRLRVVNENPLTLGDENKFNIYINATPTTPTTINPPAICEGASTSIVASGSDNVTGYSFWDQATGGTQITAGVIGNTLTTPTSLSLGTHSYFIQAENEDCISERKEVVVTVVDLPTTPSGTFEYSANPSCGPVTINFDSGYYFQTAADGESIEYPTSSSYLMSASTPLYVRDFNGSCWSPSLASAAVLITNDIDISIQPTNTNIIVGDEGIISITASNVASFQWQVNDGCGWEDIVGANSDALVISSPSMDMNRYQYRVLLTGNSPCENLISNTIELTISEVYPTAERIWFNDIEGANPNTSNPYTIDDDANSNLSVSGISRSNGINGTNANNRYNTNGWNVAELDPDKYISWTMSPNSGYNLVLNSLVLNLTRSQTGPLVFEIRTSADDFVNAFAVGLATGMHDISFGNIKIESPNNIEVRLYAYGTTAAGGTFSVNDFDFKGSVTAACTPPIIETQPHDISACYNKFKVETSASSPTYRWEVYDADISIWNKILSCNSDYSGGNSNQLTLLGDLSSLDGVQYRVKVTSDDCPIYSDIVQYSAQPIIIDVEEIGSNLLDALSCDYNGWTYYTSNDLEGRYAFAINWAPSGIISAANQNAKDDAEVIITLNNSHFSNEAIIEGVAYGTYTMKRYWNVNTLTSIDEPVNVQFPYLQSEVDEIVDAAQDYLAVNPLSKYENFNWFKIEAENFSPIPTIVTPINIMNSIALNDVFTSQQSNRFRIAQFNDITSFSGGTGATGVGKLSNPLPVTLLYFVGDCQNNDINLSWATATELNADYYIIQASINGVDFLPIGEVGASGNSNALQQYSYNASGAYYNYYRLKQVDFDGSYEYSKIIETPCNAVKDVNKVFYSTQEGFVIELLSSTNKKVQLNITSVNGQLVYSQAKEVIKGTQRWTVSSNNLPKGIYIITVGDQFDSKSTKVSVY
ncbi:MAG TPA: T9SS type A sorting domain-containing protein [Chitinophagales bacterium]|nr:T9SS type A sorting domain-containing protein [Chitinophagales bacterium]